jgi:MFS family permease
MLVTARACQGAFAALLAPAALGLLTTTFSDPRDRGRAFGVYGAIAGGGGLVGLLLGGTSLLNTIATSAVAGYLTSHLSPATAASPRARAAVEAAAAVHGYTTAFWWTAGLFAAGAVVCGTLLRRGPLAGRAQAAPAGVGAPQAEPAPSAQP